MSKSTFGMDRHELACHDAVTRALSEAGVKSDVLIGMCIEVGLEAYRDALAKSVDNALSVTTISTHMRHRLCSDGTLAIDAGTHESDEFNWYPAAVYERVFSELTAERADFDAAMMALLEKKAP
jgi:hypothetical protein